MSDYGVALCATAALLWMIVLLVPVGVQAYVSKPWFRACVLLSQRAVKLVGCLLSVGAVPEQFADQALCGYYGLTTGQYIYMSWQSAVTVVSHQSRLSGYARQTKHGWWLFNFPDVATLSLRGHGWSTC
jgi:hypothetical protein